MPLCIIVSQERKTTIKSVFGVISLFSVVFMLSVPAEARDYHVRASDGELYTITLGANFSASWDINDFSVQRSNGDVLLGITEAERTVSAELYFASKLLWIVRTYYSPNTPLEDFEDSIREIAIGGIIKLTAKQGLDILTEGFVNGLFGLIELALTRNLPLIVEGWIQEGASKVIVREFENRLLIDAAVLAKDAARKAVEHEKVLRNFWLSYETQNIIISIDEINAAWESFYKLVEYRLLATNLADKYLKGPDLEVNLGLPSELGDVAIRLLPAGKRSTRIAQTIVKISQGTETIVQTLETIDSINYTLEHIEQLRDIRENAGSKIHQYSLSRIDEGKKQARTTLEQAAFFQPTQVRQLQDIQVLKDEAPQRLDVKGYFSPMDTGNLTYIGRSQDLSVAVAHAESSGSSVIIITPKGVGSTSVVVELKNFRGLSVVQSFTVTVGQEAQQIEKPEVNVPDNRNPNDDVPSEDDPVKDSDVPDLVVENIRADYVTMYPEERFTVSVTIRNAGGRRASNTILHYYFSSDPTFSSDDEEIEDWRDGIGALASGEAVSDHANLDAPSKQGTYYIIARIDRVRNERNTTNNSDVIKITVLPPRAPDLVVLLSANKDLVDPKDFFRLETIVLNEGEEDASTQTTVRYYISSDPTFSSDDEEIGTDTIKKLKDGRSDDASHGLHAPEKPGEYYFFTCVDSVENERNVDNNCSKVFIINVRGPDLIVHSISEKLSTRKSTLAPNGIFKLNVTVKNQGTDDVSGSTTLRYYHSSDANVSTNDMQIDHDRVYSLDVNETSGVNESKWIHAPYAAGVYYYGACVDILAEEIHKDNNCSDPITITVRNVAPRPEGAIAPQALHVGEPMSVDVSGYFIDENKDHLSYTPSSSDTRVATASKSGPDEVTINPIGVGSTIVTVTASDGELTATQTIAVSVGDAIFKETWMPDANLRKAVRDALKLQEDEPLTQQAMQGLTTLTAYHSQIANLTGLEHATNLESLYLDDNDISDVTPLAGLTGLTELWLRGNDISDVTPLAGLTGLTELWLNSNDISDIAPFNGLTNLTHLDPSGNDISDVTPLAGLTGLTHLYFSSNDISDITPLAGLTGLTHLYLGRNDISDVTPLTELKALTDLSLEINDHLSNIAPLAGLTRLQILFIAGNQIGDIASLAGLTRLTHLDLSSNQIGDITPLAGLTRLSGLYLAHNGINDVTPLAGLTGLTHLDLYDNNINDVTPLTGLRRLWILGLSDNDINDVTPLANLTALTDLRLYENEIVNIAPLAGLVGLKLLYLNSNDISDVTPLKDLTALTRLQLRGNPIADLAPLHRLKDKNPNLYIDIDINADINNIQGAPTAPVLPAETTLLLNYPNPFNPETWIPYQLAEPADVTVFIYSADGKPIRTLKLGQQAAGIYASRSRAAHWDGRNIEGELVASGIYFYTLKAGEFTATRKMLIRK